MIDYFLRQIVYPTRNPLYQLNTKRFQPERLSRDAQLILAIGIGSAALWWLAEAASADATTSGRYLSALGNAFLQLVGAYVGC
jgi:Trk-type K+ transport system membrane component